ncbi:MAG: nucleoside triphosphate pyrophosphohydrolase [Pseudomonadota bacterium]
MSSSNPKTDISYPAGHIDRLLHIMAQLRSPNGGCPWDLDQDFESIAPYTIEEAYEVAEAIRSKNMADLRDELGDLLLQVVFHARMAEEEEAFDFSDVVAAICDKMLRRHPHVFGAKEIDGVAAQNRAWEDHKAAERQAAADGPVSVVDGIAVGLPGLTRAIKLQNRAARVGFDWPDTDPVFAKIEEESGEVRDAMERGLSADKIEEEVGDLLFVAANLARHLKVDPEAALRRANAKFERRFRQVETSFDHDLDGVSLEAMDEVWNRVKKQEDGPS